MLVAAQLVRDLIGDEAAIRPHRIGDIFEDLVAGLFFDDKEGKAGNDVVAVRVSEFKQGFREMLGIGVQYGHARICGEIFSQMFGKFLVQLEEDESGLWVHAFDDLAGVATFTWPEFHHHSGFREIDAFGSLTGKKWRTWHDVTNSQRIGQDTFEE